MATAVVARVAADHPLRIRPELTMVRVEMYIHLGVISKQQSNAVIVGTIVAARMRLLND